VTGRGRDHAYLDPDLYLSLCHDDHELVHEDLRAEQVDRPTEEASAGRRVAYRLRRTALLLVRVAESVSSLQWLARLAEALRRWASELEEGEADGDR